MDATDTMPIHGLSMDGRLAYPSVRVAVDAIPDDQ